MRWARSSYQSLIVARNSGHMTFLVRLPVSAATTTAAAQVPDDTRVAGRAPGTQWGPGSGFPVYWSPLRGRDRRTPRPRCLLESSPAPPLSLVVAVRAAYPLGPEGAAVDKD